LGPLKNPSFYIRREKRRKDDDDDVGIDKKTKKFLFIFFQN
jgi:hypothetical protein